MTTQVKLIQAGRALADGADELDVAMDVSAFRSGDYAKVTDELKALRDVAGDRPIKVICYSAVLAGDDALRAAQLILDAGVRFLVTDPLFGYVTAPEQVRAIKARFGTSLRLVASGEVRTHRGALAMIDAGADRIGTNWPFGVLGVEP
jgi:deoxyribose-phosphate aldolase